MTLKRVQNCLQVTLEKKRFLDLSHKQLSAVPKCLQKLCDIDELNLSANEIRVIPSFIVDLRSISVLDLHSNYVSTTQQTRLCPRPSPNGESPDPLRVIYLHLVTINLQFYQPIIVNPSTCCL